MSVAAAETPHQSPQRITNAAGPTDEHLADDTQREINRKRCNNQQLSQLSVGSGANQKGRKLKPKDGEVCKKDKTKCDIKAWY
jgi:hypothetical protein